MQYIQSLKKHRSGLYALLTGILLISGCSGGKNKPVTPVATKTPPAAAPPPERFPKPQHVRGIYLTAWGAGSTKKMDKVIAMLDRTELNSLVIDVRDAGEVYWDTGVPLVKEAKALKLAVVKPDKLMDRLEKAKVYPIARIACFRDNFLPKKHPERAVNNVNGGLWKDGGGYMWLDPYNKKNWEYIGQIVDFALEQGFPEIQLDYVRFPSEGKASTQRFPAKKYYDDPNAKPTQVVAAFANFIRDRVKKKGRVISADIFGIVSSGSSDQGIGQELETVAAPFDLICPMVYPSHYHKGEYGIKDPNRSPHAIILKSLKDYAERLPNKKLRPWLQDFSLYGVTYGKEQVQAQIKAAKEIGYEEYLLWNASNKYTEAAVKDNSKLVEKKATAKAVEKPASK